MQKLSYEVLKNQNYNGYLLEKAPEKVLQFGEGNFLRAFADYFIDMMNEKADFNGKVVVVQPRAKRSQHTIADSLNEQEGLYTLYLRGFENGKKVNDKRIISCISRCLNSHADFEEVMKCAENPELRYIISNTTEAGIVYDASCQFTDKPAASFPGKLTQFLYHRFEIFGRETGKGFILLPCELIDDNGIALKECVLKYAAQWNLGDDFIHWIEAENTFCSTLVDRIVTGYPTNEISSLTEENGYEDEALTTGEVFGFWAIEGPEWLNEELPFRKANLPVIVTDNQKPYKKRKVRILNGAHTSMVLGAYLAGQDIVRNCMEDDIIRGYMNKAIYEEIIPTIDLPKDELENFAFSVTERFKNPFIDHSLLAIALNSTSKWKARVLPTVKDFIKQTGTLPKCLTTSFALYIAFYHNGKELDEKGLHAVRKDGTQYVISDDRFVLEFYYAHKDDSARDLAFVVCQNTEFWGEDLSQIKGLAEMVADTLETIEAEGTWQVMKNCL